MCRRTEIVQDEPVQCNGATAISISGTLYKMHVHARDSYINIHAIFLFIRAHHHSLARWQTHVCVCIPTCVLAFVCVCVYGLALVLLLHWDDGMAVAAAMTTQPQQHACIMHACIMHTV